MSDEGGGCVVVIGTRKDPCCAMVARRLEDDGVAVVFLDEQDMFPGLEFSLRLDGVARRGGVAHGNVHMPFESIKGVLARPFGTAATAEEYASKNGRYLSAEWHALLHGWLAGLDCTVVNRLRPELWYKSHLTPAVLRVHAPAVGFRYPRTCVTTDLEQARGFFASCPGGVYYSPLAQHTSYEVRTRDDLARAATLDGYVPWQLTEIVGGGVWWAAVAGDEVILFTSAGARPAPDREIVALCEESATALGLEFCLLELVHSPSSEWFCTGISLFPRVHRWPHPVQRQVAGRLARRLRA